jgi:cyclohexanecarboxylate-CoA ligase
MRATGPPVPAATLARWEAEGLRTRERLGWVLPAAARRAPDDVAVITADGPPCTFGELAVQADAIAATLLAAGIGAGDVVTWMLPNAVTAVATAAAIWRIGAISNPVVPIYRRREVAFIVGQLRPAAVLAAVEVRGRALCAEIDEALADAGHEPRLRLAFAGAHPGWTTGLADAPLGADVQPAEADAPALVLYTSGTTSEPKGVVHSSATLLQEAASMVQSWALTHRDTIMMASPLTHITGMLQGLIIPCRVGAPVVLLDRWDPERCVALIEREHVTYMAGATPFLQGILDAYERRGGRPSLRQFCCGGAAVSPALIERADALGIAAHRSWGLTEFPSGGLARPTDPLDRRARTDGRIGHGIEAEAVDDARRPLPVGSEGELRLRGPERMLGYVDASRNAEVLDEDGWVYTGDVGIVGTDGFITVTGRLKDIINRGGEKFSAREIEEDLLAHPAVHDVAVIALPEPRLGEQVCAVVVPTAGATVDPEALVTFLADRGLARQKLPTRIEVVDDLPRTASGKVQKHLLVTSLS